MENKKLIKILLKDMGELEEVISDVKSNGGFNPFEMEFIHTRAKGILQLMQMLNSQDEVVSVHVSEKNNALKSQTKKKDENDNIHQLYEDSPKVEQELAIEHSVVKPEQEIILQPVEPVSETEVSANKEITDKGDGKNEEVVLDEDNGAHEAASRLGDSFFKGKSINDLVTEHANLESKLSNLPVSSIQSSIGINDRFQYIRELFDGDGQKFQDTVKTIDSMHNLNEAAEYLRNNFKWKKNETSLKFVNLVKRRFLNE